MKVMYAVIAFLLLAQVAQAQLRQPARFEIETKQSDHDFIIISLENEGIALFRETEKYKDGKRNWQLIVLDTGLHQKTDTLLLIDNDYTFVGHEYVRGHLNLLFQEGEFAKNKMTFCSINLTHLDFKITEVKTELDLRLTHFSSIRANLLLGGYIREEPAVLFFDVKESKVKLVPGFLQKNTELLDLRVNENHTFNVVLAEKKGSEAKRIIFRTFDSQGKLLLEDLIEIENPRIIQTAISSSLQREDLLLVGAWSIRNSTKAYGFYTTLVNPFEEQKITYTPFGSLSQYLDYLKPRRVEKIKNKTKEALASGKIYDYTNQVILYKVIEQPNGYFVLAETYSPINTSPSNYYNNPTTNPNNWNNPYYYNNPFYNPYPTSRIYRPISFSENVTNEDEIKTYSSTLLYINTKGIIENDFSLKIENRKLSSIMQVTDATFFNSNLLLLYREKNNLICKKIDPLSAVTEENKEPIQLKDPFDELRAEQENGYGVRHWHENYFYTWGNQTIRNLQAASEKTRNVFYLSKIHIQ
jgi:hypothetical protein